jgi:hypothetical protein
MKVIVNMKSSENGVFAALENAGHVVLLSGTTLFFTFALLIGFHQNFLQVESKVIASYYIHCVVMEVFVCRVSAGAAQRWCSPPCLRT